MEKTSPGRYQIKVPSVHLHPIEALALFAAGRLIYHQATTTQYKSALEKLARMLPEPLRSLLQRSTEGLENRRGDSRTLEMVARALIEGRILAFEYRSAGSKNWRPKELLPYFLEANRTNLGLYVIGYERSYHQRIQTFKLTRMRNVRLLEETYTLPKDFDPRTYLHQAWGVVGAREGTVEVRLRFAPEVAQRILEEERPGLEILEEGPDGSLIARIQAVPFKQGIPWEILPWLQGFGPRVEVLAPEGLRNLLMEEARKVIALYSKTPVQALS